MCILAICYTCIYNPLIENVFSLCCRHSGMAFHISRALWHSTRYKGYWLSALNQDRCGCILCHWAYTGGLAASRLRATRARTRTHSHRCAYIPYTPALLTSAQDKREDERTPERDNGGRECKMENERREEIKGHFNARNENREIITR